MISMTRALIYTLHEEDNQNPECKLVQSITISNHTHESFSIQNLLRYTDDFSLIVVLEKDSDTSCCAILPRKYKYNRDSSKLNGGRVIMKDWKNTCEVEEKCFMNSERCPLGFYDARKGTALLCVGVIIGVLSLCLAAFFLTRKIKLFKKKRRDENTINIETYATANEIQYAELYMRIPQNSNIIGGPQDTPYAEIIGVLGPKNK